MCSLAVKKQYCNSLKFAILEKEKKKKKLNVVLKTVLFMLFGKKRYCVFWKGGTDYYFLEGFNFNYLILCQEKLKFWYVAPPCN